MSDMEIYRELIEARWFPSSRPSTNRIRLLAEQLLMGTKGLPAAERQR